MCKIKGGTFLIVISHFRVACLFTFASSWHWCSFSFLSVQLGTEAEEKLFSGLRGQRALGVRTILVPEEKQRNHGHAEKLPHEMGKRRRCGTSVSPQPLEQGAFRDPGVTRSLCRKRGFEAPRDSRSRGSFLFACTGNGSADLSQGSRERAKLLAGASESVSRVSSAYARAALCTLARIGTVLSALKNSSLLCLSS